MGETTRSTRHRAALLLLAGTALLLLAGCGGGDDEEVEPAPTTASAAPTSTVGAEPPGGDADGGGSTSAGETFDIDACTVLGADEIAGIVGGDWTEEPTAPGECSYNAADEMLVLTVYADRSLLDEVRTSSTGDRFVEDIEAFAGGAVVAGDPSVDTYLEVWVEVGGAELLALVQRTGTLSADEMLEVVETSALAFENRPIESDTGSGGSSDSGGVVAVGDLTAVVFEIEVPSTGRSLGLTVTVEDVVAAQDPLSTQIYCIDLAAASGPMGDIYAVLGVDRRITDGLRSAQLEATEEVDGPGTYQGALELSEADGDRFSFTGPITIEGTGDSGTFELEDASGAGIVGSWTCERG